MIDSISGVLTSLHMTAKALEAAIDARDNAKAKESLIQFTDRIIELQNLILSSQADQARLASDVEELKQECMRLKSWDAERAKYTLTEIASGVFAYVENDNVKPFNNTHKLCCSCFEKGIKSTLQSVPTLTGVKSSHSLSCANNCPILTFLRYKDHLQ